MRGHHFSTPRSKMPLESLDRQEMKLARSPLGSEIFFIVFCCLRARIVVSKSTTIVERGHEDQYQHVGSDGSPRPRL